jgi:putative tricarboxylic transport membrane protein
VLKLPFTILAPIIYILCLIGGYAPTQDLHDVWLMLIFGVFGYLLRKLDYPMAPAVLAIVLGPMAEASVRQSLLMSGGSFTIFFMRPGSAVIMSIALLLFLAPLLKLIKDKVFKSRSVAEEPAEPS